MRTRLAILCTFLLCLSLPTLAHAAPRIEVDVAWGKTTPRESDWSPQAEGARPYFPNESQKEPQSLWLRYRVSNIDVMEPVLFLNTVDDAFVAYSNETEIYKWGEYGDNGRPKFQGRPWHMVPLAPNTDQQTVVLRIDSESPQIGVMGNSVVDSRATLTLSIWKREIDKLFIAWQAMFTGFIGIFFGLRRRVRVDFLSAGVFSFMLGLWIQSTAWTQSKLFLWNHPLAWFYLDVYSLVLLFIPLSFFMKEVLGKYGAWLKYAILIYAVLSPLAILASILNWVSLLTVLAAFQVTYFLYSALALSSVALAFFKGNREAGIIAVGVTSLALLGAYDVLLDLRIIQGQRQFSYWGGYIFVISMFAILRQRFSETYSRLSQYRQRMDLILSSTRAMSLADDEVQAIMIFCIDLANVELIPASSKLMVVPDDGCPNIKEPATFNVPTIFSANITRERLVTDSKQILGAQYEFPAQNGTRERGQFSAIQLIPRGTIADDKYLTTVLRPVEVSPSTSVTTRLNEMVISLAYHEKYVLHLIFEIEKEKELNSEDLNFVRAMAESLSIVLLGLELTAERRDEHARLLEQDKHNLLTQVSLAAHLSDKLNSPLLVLENALHRIHLSLEEKKLGADNKNDEGLLAKLVEMLDDAVRKIKAVSRKLSDLREKGKNIETTQIINTGELEAENRD